MHKQEYKAGFKQYLISLMLGIFVWIGCDLLGLFIKNQLVSDIIFIIAGGVVIYYVYVHYCAVFSYEAYEKKLKIIRKLGRKEITEEIPYSKIDKIYFKKPDNMPKKVVFYTVGLVMKKRFCYIVYDKKSKCVVIEPNEEMVKVLKENIHG